MSGAALTQIPTLQQKDRNQAHVTYKSRTRAQRENLHDTYTIRIWRLLLEEIAENANQMMMIGYLT